MGWIQTLNTYRNYERKRLKKGEVYTTVEATIERGDTPIISDMFLTPKAKEVIEAGAEEARRLGHNSMGVLHLLLGVLRDEHTALVLERFGTTLEKARSETITILNLVPLRLPLTLVKRLETRRKTQQDIAGVIEELLTIAEGGAE